MANYFITNTARFNPFTLNELASYAAQITDRENAFLDEFNNIDDGTLATYLANENPETSAYRRQYDDLMAKLQDASTKINNREYSSDLFRDVKNIRGEYKKLQTPVEAGYKRRAEDINTYNKLYASDPSLIGQNPNEISLEEYIKNPSFRAQYTSGDKLLSYGMLAGKEFASDFTPTFTPIMGGKYYQMQTKKTATMEDIQTNPRYQEAVNNILRQRGINPEGTDDFSRRARLAVENGMYQTMKDPGIEIKANPGYNSGGGRGQKVSRTTIYTNVQFEPDGPKYNIEKRGTDYVKIELDEKGKETNNISTLSKSEAEKVNLDKVVNKDNSSYRTPDLGYRIYRSDGVTIGAWSNRDKAASELGKDPIWSQARLLADTKKFHYPSDLSKYNPDKASDAQGIDEVIIALESNIGGRILDENYKNLAEDLDISINDKLTNVDKYKILQKAKEYGVEINLKNTTKRSEITDQFIYINSKKYKTNKNQTQQVQQGDEDDNYEVSQEAPKYDPSALIKLAETYNNEFNQ